MHVDRHGVGRERKCGADGLARELLHRVWPTEIARCTSTGCVLCSVAAIHTDWWSCVSRPPPRRTTSYSSHYRSWDVSRSILSASRWHSHKKHDDGDDDDKDSASLCLFGPLSATPPWSFPAAGPPFLDRATPGFGAPHVRKLSLPAWIRDHKKRRTRVQQRMRKTALRLLWSTRAEEAERGGRLTASSDSPRTCRHT